ncbi:MAG: F0F1 ATP synthase subunit A [Proteobacteria bacterium]|nr:F0F1 ATP synthase subunit A [Pseudomonadota bacterium]
MDLLSQFKIKTLIPISVFGVDISFTNASFFMMLTVGFFCFFCHIALKEGRIIPKSLQAVVEVGYQFISNTILSSAGKDGLVYIPYILSIFTFIFLSSALGVIPGFFTTTSQIILTGMIALFVFISITVIGFVRHKTHFLNLFFPRDVPWFIAILLVPVEIISYFARPFSLSIRLFANMIAGHILLKMFASFATIAFGMLFLPVAFTSVIVNLAFTFFEIGVAFLQAYIFTVLSCVYLKDALYLH